MDGQQLAGWTQGERECVVHRKPVSYPVPCVAREFEFGELLGAIRGSEHGFEKLVVDAGVVAADAEAALGDVYGLRGISRGFLDDVRA